MLSIRLTVCVSILYTLRLFRSCMLRVLTSTVIRLKFSCVRLVILTIKLKLTVLTLNGVNT